MRVQGSSLIEVMVALALVLLGGLGAIHVLVVVQQQWVLLAARQQAVLLAEEKLETLRAISVSAPDCHSSQVQQGEQGVERVQRDHSTFARRWQRQARCSPARWHVSIEVSHEGGQQAVIFESEYFDFRVH